MGKALTLAALLALAACTTTPSGSFCDLATDKNRPSQAEIDAMSDERRAEVLAFYLKGQKLCGWKPST
jgi:hypothetical protein